jgi:hypothetical protein
MELILKTNSTKCRFGQRQHTVICDGERIGTLYDNRECDRQPTNFVFLEGCTDGLLLHAGENPYLQRAEGVKGDDLTDTLAQVRAWAEARAAKVAELEADFRAAIASLPVPQWAGDAITFNACVSGPRGAFKAALSADDVAKVIGHSYFECGEHQLPKFGTGEQYYGCKWTYMHRSSVISVVTYSGNRLMSITRSEAHKALAA